MLASTIDMSDYKLIEKNVVLYLPSFETFFLITKLISMCSYFLLNLHEL